MEIPKSLLGAILLGITVQTTSCIKGDNNNVQPNGHEQCDGECEQEHTDIDCPACGMG